MRFKPKCQILHLLRNKQVAFWKVIILLLLELTGLKINWKFVSLVRQPSESSFTTRKLRLRRTCFHHVDKEPSFAAHQLRGTQDPSHHKAHEKQVGCWLSPTLTLNAMLHVLLRILKQNARNMFVFSKLFKKYHLQKCQNPMLYLKVA